MNELGPFLNVFEIWRNRKDFSIIFLGGKDGAGGANVAYILCRFFGGSSVPPAGLAVPGAFAFPLLSGFTSQALPSQNLQNVEVVQWLRDWVIHINRLEPEAGEEVWSRVVVCSKCWPDIT